MNFFKNLFKKSKTYKQENNSFSASVSTDKSEVFLPTVKFEPLHREGNRYITTRKVAFKKV